MGRWWLRMAVVVVALGGLWALVWAANQWLFPALDCLLDGSASCSPSALTGVVLLAVLAALYGVWRLLRQLTRRPPR